MRNAIIVLAVCLMGLQIFDGISTYILVDGGYCYEANPIMNNCMKNYGLTESIIFVKGLALLIISLLIIKIRKYVFKTVRERVFILSIFLLCDLFYLVMMVNYNFKYLIGVM